jgi:hypothetical protein
MSPVYLFIQIQILIGFQPNRFVTKYSKITERIKNISELKCNIELEIRFKT